MDIVSLDDPVVPDAPVEENVNTSYENEALELQTGDEIIHGYKITCSQSSIEYDKSGDSKRRGTRSRSKSFLEEPSRSQAALFMQRKPGGKGLSSTYGSHGDGICLWPSWDINTGFTGSDSKEKTADQEKKLQIVFTDTSTQAGGVTQKLFDSNVTFADLVRVYTTQENNVQNCRVQLGNTLLSTVHASTLVSNYLNTYRSYLDYLRKTCGRGDSHEQLSSPRAPPKSVPLFLPLAGMTSVFSDDSKEDPEFVELLKKTTTESIRKLWPHSNKNYIGTSALTDPSENKDKESVQGTDNGKTDSGSSEAFTDSSLQQFEDSPECDSSQYGSDEGQHSNCDKLKVFRYSYMCDNQLTLQEDSNISTNNPNYTMKFSSDSVLVGDGDSANVQNMNPAQLQKGLLEASDTQPSVDNLYKNTSTGPMVVHSNTSGLSSWSNLGQQNCSNESTGQQNRQSTLDTLLLHQQKLAQQQQLQRQMMQHHQHLQQQRQQQQQLLQQYQQQEQQRQQSEQFSAAKSYCFQSSSDPTKSWLHTVGDGSGLGSYRPCVSGNSQSISSYKTEPVMSQPAGIDSFGNSYQMNTDYFVSNSGQCLPTRASHMDAPTNCFPEAPAHARTLKASYACLDPSNPMTLSVDPLHDYPESDLFMNNCDMSLYDRQSFSNLPSQFGPSFDDRANCPESSRMWAKMSRPVTSFNDSENGGKSLEERLRKAYAKSRISQFAQQGQWNDASRLSVQRPIVKVNTVSEMSEDGQSYPFQRGLLDSGNRRVPTTNSVCNQDRWNRLVCSESLDTNGNDCVPPNSSSIGDEKGISRLFQWKQDSQPSNKSSFFQAARSPGDMSNFAPNDSVVHSLLSGLQLDRDFSWNASSMSSHLSSHPAQNSLFQCHDVHGQDSDAIQCKLSDSSKLDLLSADQRRQLSNNNNAAAAGLCRTQSDQVNDSNMYYDSGEAKHNTWSLKNRQEIPGDQIVSGLNSMGSGPVLSPSMQILNKKILAAQSNIKSHQSEGSSGNSYSDGDSPNGKELEKIQSRTSTPSSVDSQSTDNVSKRRLNRAFGDATSNAQTHASMSSSQLSATQQQARQNNDNPVFKLSEDLEKTFLEDIPNTTPWHELTSQESIDNDFNTDNGNNDNKYFKMANFNTVSDQDAVALRSADTNRIYNAQQGTKDHRMQSSLAGHQVPLNHQGTTTPRMILGANSVKQTHEDKIKSDVEESNRRLRQMLGLAPSKDQCGGVSVAGMRLQDSSQMPPQTPSPGIMSMGQLSGPYAQNGSPVAAGQMPRMQVSGGKIQTSVGLAQQMYCVPNILMPPPTVQPQNASRPSNMIPIQGVMTSIGTGSRFPQGMIQVPFVDMSRLVYVHQVPVSMATAHPSNNNHNNSSSSNPHVNTSNIITINTSDNDFSAGGQGDKSGRHVRSNPGKNKTTFIKVRSGSEEFAVPIIGVRPPLDDGVSPRLVKSRTNPWDQDLDHDFSNSLMSKTVNMENMPGACSSVAADGGFVNPELGLLYPDITNVHGGGQAGIEQTAKTATFMQWPAAADIHPEMLDMLPMRRSVPEDCGSGRLCWPEMEFLMSSREQLQSARRSNKPVGSNKANLISIIPKENAIDGLGGIKETRFEKIDNKIV